MLQSYFIKNKIVIFWLRHAGDIANRLEIMDIAQSNILHGARSDGDFVTLYGKNMKLFSIDEKETPFMQVYKSIKYCEMMQCS